VGLAVSWGTEVVANCLLPRPHIHPGEEATVLFSVTTPEEVGTHCLRLELVEYEVTTFADRGVEPVKVDIQIEAAKSERTEQLWSRMQRFDPWQYLPTQGVRRGPSGTTYPVFVERAEGCRVWDTTGTEYLDYTMGWGAILLGYAHPKVSGAIRDMLTTTPICTLPNPVEIELAEMLVEDIPCAEMVAFAKNGSDACSFAIRMARVLTGRKTVLFSGYHGWQDFWVEQVGFERTGVPTRTPPIIYRFEFHRIDQFRALLAEHRDDLAAVIIEPSPWAGDGLGFEPDTDPVFLREVADSTREAGGLFILDEIVTGYRYPEHSVQAAKGVIPDLTCLGKALASGMPLSAVVGRADILKQALPKTFFASTFHGEAYTFAAAKAAVEIYRSEPVAKHVWDYGAKLKEGVDRIMAEQGLPASLLGPPFRMSLILRRDDPEVLLLERTLLQQELLKRGLLTYNGVMLPCYAHDDSTLATTLEIFGAAAEVVARASQAGDWGEHLEIPPLLDL
jgi:glutamate-1-semialdehyde aminotransferase